MSEALERRVGQLEKSTALAKQRIDYVEEAMDVIGDRITGINEKKLTPMAKQLNDLHHSIYGSKGFWAGVFMTVSALWAIITTVGVVVWQWVKANNGG